MKPLRLSILAAALFLGACSSPTAPSRLDAGASFDGGSSLGSGNNTSTTEDGGNMIGSGNGTATDGTGTEPTRGVGTMGSGG